jgi:hypothetical protein
MAVVYDTRASIRASENPIFATSIIAPLVREQTGKEPVLTPVTDTDVQANQIDWLARVGTTIYPYEIKTTVKHTHWAYECIVKDRLGWVDKYTQHPSQLSFFDGYDVSATTLVYAWGDGKVFTCPLEDFKDWAMSRRNVYWLKAKDRRNGYYTYEIPSASLYGGTYTSVGMMVPRQTLIDNFKPECWVQLDAGTHTKIGDAVKAISDANKQTGATI